jgi:hypothetical protein
MTDPAISDPDLQSAQPTRLRYRVLTGPDDRSFCERVSAALDEGYELHGSPALAHDGTRAVVAQALVLPLSGPASATAPRVVPV